MASCSLSTDGRAKGVKYPFRSTHSLLWKSCQRDNSFANPMKGSIINKKRITETASSNMMHSNSNHFEISKVDPADTLGRRQHDQQGRSKTNAGKSNMFSSCVDQSTPGKDSGYMVESKFVTINSGFAMPVIKNSADTEDVMIQCYINNLSRKFFSNICRSDMIVMDV
ncbi:hypothetical protein O3P69_001768 [Scylla paramamosain]|uniref:Uncharacterized protein n=1 Tax=Scylla paramamosain TaxID=85552 RepID=A0AAW0UZA1_SCYPA